ncbi:MAG: hypothetical protein MJ198_03110 [Bacteroidales bacterium]|nr:hypothetical protein [Bacteroidales bacterium]
MLCIFSLSAFSQGEVDTQNKILFSDDYSCFIGLNTNGFGFGYRYGKYVDYLHKNIYTIQFANLRSPKEIRLSSATGMTIYGKSNNVGCFHFLIGRKSEKFSKFDKNSVAIYWTYNGGFALAIEKPTYYHVLYPDGKDIIEKFDESVYTKYGKASFSYGLNELKFVPGLIATTSAEFNFSSRNAYTSSVEIGTNLQTYLRKINLMCNDENSWYFVTLFVNLHFGKLRNEF